MKRDLPQFARDLLSAPPRRGEGLNLWIFRIARVLHPYRDELEIIDTIEAVIAGEQIKPGEIERAVARSKSFAWHPGQSAPIPIGPGWPGMNTELRETIIASGRGLVDLWEASPVWFDDSAPQTEGIIDVLFPGNPLLCVGQSSHQFATLHRQELKGRLAAAQLIVPSPMSTRTGNTQDGKESQHTLENTGPRRFLVIEQDSGHADEQAAVLLHLAEHAPLALAVHSGNRSIHGWIYCAGQVESKLRHFMRYAVRLGADRATWTRSQFVRMPDGSRDNGNRQAIYFFNPEVLR
jgi:hypothetical protein